MTFILLNNSTWAKDYVIRQTQEICPNKTVYITANTKSIDDIKFQFGLISSLPFGVYVVEKNKEKSKLAITHLMKGQTPNAWEMQKRVWGMLKDKMEEYKVTNISIQYDPKVTCP